MAWKTIDDVALAGKTVLTRVDINVPMEGGVVTDMTRPVRPNGCERETESLAESARMPSSDRAPATVVEVVQNSLVCPSTVTVSRRP